MGDTKRDLVDEINEELKHYNRRYDDGMTHEEGQDFARSWHAVLNGAAIEIAGLRAERDAALARAERTEGGMTDNNNGDTMKLDRDRPYDGPIQTTYGARGKTLVVGLTMRDIADCYVMGVLLSSYPAPEHSKVAAGTWEPKDLYALDLNKLDPVAIQQNMSCCIEKMMGIYPNIPILAREDVEQTLEEKP